MKFRQLELYQDDSDPAPDSVPCPAATRDNNIFTIEPLGDAVAATAGHRGTFCSMGCFTDV